MLDSILRDIRFAVRTLAKAPTFTAGVVATIALAVGATTAMFAVVNGILLRPLPFPGSDDTVVLCETNPGLPAGTCVGSPMNVADIARESMTLDSAGVGRTETFIARDGGDSYSVSGGIASPGFFRVLRAKPMLGRLLEDRDMPRGANQVVLVSHDFWRTRLGGDPGIVGRPVAFDSGAFTVIGVLAPDAYFPGAYLSRAEVWKPLTASIDNVENRAWRGFTAIARRRAGVSAAAMNAELETLRSQLAAAYPEANRDWGLRTEDLRQNLVDDVGSTLWIFLGAVVLVLLIACANVASLLLVRATRRTPEFAVRAALGASRGRLAQQLLTESLLLSLAGGGLGLLLASWATAAFVAVAPGSIPRLDEVGIDARVALFAFLLAAGAALLFSFAPVRQAAAWERVGAGNRVAGANTRLRSAFVVVQLALALMLLFGAGLLTRSFGRLLQWDPGFEREGLATIWMLPPAGEGSRLPLMERVRDEVESLPGIKAAALGSGGPLLPGVETGGMVIDGRPLASAADAPPVHWFNVSPDYFETLGVRLVKGRGLAQTDGAGSPPVCVVNETLARRFFQGEEPVGRRISVDDHAAEIVGLVSDTKPFRPDEPIPPQVFWPYRQKQRGAAFLFLRVTPGVAGIEKAVRARAGSALPGVQLSAMVSLDERFARNLVGSRFNMLLVASFAVVAMILAAVGVYGVIAYALASRTRELGVRVALGATPGRLVGSVVRGGMTLALVGVLAGCAGALAGGRMLTSLLHGVPPADPLTLGAAVSLLMLVAAAACWVPARRASRVDPIEALRVE